MQICGLEQVSYPADDPGIAAVHGAVCTESLSTQEGTYYETAPVSLQIEMAVKTYFMIYGQNPELHIKVRIKT